MKYLAPGALVLGTFALTFISYAAEGDNVKPAEFTTHVVDGKINGGYMIAVADVNKDGKPDIIPMGTSEVAWYENPTWERHQMTEACGGRGGGRGARGAPPAPCAPGSFRGLLWASPADLDGDGIPEFVILSDFGQDPKTSKGTISILKANGDPKQPWKSYQVDQVPTAHRVTFADLDGDGRPEIVMAPFVGETGWDVPPGGRGGKPVFDASNPLYYWSVPKDLNGPYKRMVVDDKFKGVIHHLHAVKWTPGKKDELLVAGFDGVVLETPSGKGDKMKFTRTVLTTAGEKRDVPGAGGETQGANDMWPITIKGKRFLAVQEPWHGDSIAVYSQSGKNWVRHEVFKGLVEGHEMAVGDLNGDGRDDIVAVDTMARRPGAKASVNVWYCANDAGTEWRHELVDVDGMVGSGVVVRDINGDGKPDIVAISLTQVKWYENMGAGK